jgi:hypothetical protein
MADGPDVRALSYLLSVEANGHRPARCTGCPFARPYLIAGGRVLCDLLGDGTVTDPAFPRCTSGHWGERARAELAALQADNGLLTAVARDAREESSMYNRGLAEGRASEREACCKAVCPDCEHGVSLWEHPGDEGWFHDRGDGVRVERCRADRIRRRAGEDGR